MKVSIVIPSFNQDQFITESVESVLKQIGDFEIECLVYDGGSTDSTVKLLKEISSNLDAGKYDSNGRRPVLKWVSQKDDGQSDAINQGLSKCTGEICAYLNSDDYYVPGCFQKVVDQFQKQPTKIWLTGYCQIVDSTGKPIRSIIARYKNFWLRHYSFRKLLVLNFISQPATFWLKSAVDKFGLFNPELHYVMDYEYWLRIGQDNDPIIMLEPLSNFRIHQTSKGQTQAKKQFAEDLAISRQFSRSPWLNIAHNIHNRLILFIYRFI